MDQSNFATNFSSTVINNVKSNLKNKKLHIGHGELTDSFINSDLCIKMIENIQKNLHENGIDVNITATKVNSNQHQLNISID